MSEPMSVRVPEWLGRFLVKKYGKDGVIELPLAVPVACVFVPLSFLVLILNPAAFVGFGIVSAVLVVAGCFASCGVRYSIHEED